jgi:hypothetical protein
MRRGRMQFPVWKGSSKHKSIVNKKQNVFCRFCRVPMVMLWLVLRGLASGKDDASSFPNPFPAENFVLNNLTNKGFIDLATFRAGSAAATNNRVIRGKFLEWLLSKNAEQLSHDGLRLANAVIEGPVDLSNVEVPAQVQLSCCHFKQKLNLTAAHFGHDLSFVGCLFDGSFEANSLRVDGTLELKPFYFRSPWKIGSGAAPPSAASFNNFFSTNQTIQSWSPGQTEFLLDTNRVTRAWEIDDVRFLAGTNRWTNSFIATSWGNALFVVQQYENVLAQASNSVIGLTFGPLTNQWKLTANGALDLDSVRVELAAALGTNVEFIRARVLTTNAACAIQSVGWQFDNRTNSSSLPLVARWFGAGSVNFFQPTVFRGEAWLNGASIGGKLDANAVEFRTLGCHSLKVGDDLLLTDSHCEDAAIFIFAQSGHDCSLQDSIFEKGFDATGLNVGGSLIIDHARFRRDAHFDGVSVGSDFKSQYARFEDSDSMAEFRGLKVDGFVDLLRAHFAGPANFILASVKGNFQAQGAVFADRHNFDDLQRLTGNSFTFNTDFGSMQVDGFAIFENVLFTRSVSFRNARFANFYLDGARWPESRILMTYTNDPKPNELLRLEGMDFETIRDVASGHFLHTYDQLVESQTNLLKMFARRSPYSFDIYTKLENYFLREGAPGLADDVHVEARKREGKETTSVLAKIGNGFLRYTVDYGRSPWLAFGESLGLILIWGALCKHFMVKKSAQKKPPSFVLALFFSLGTFLPFIDLGASDLLDYRAGKEWFHYVIALEKILGYILVPLWTMSLTGLIK